MHRIDGPTAAPALPAPAAVSGTPGYFSGGDPQTATSPTTVTHDWANALQEEVGGVIEAAGIALDKANHGQLLTALQALFAGASGSNGNGHWEKRPGGTVEQWGTVLGSFGEGTQAVTFPIPFPTVCDQIQATAINAVGSSTHDIWAQAESWTVTDAVVFLNFVSSGGTPNIDGFNWRAIGR